ncbi:MAG: N-6 DNA methylase [Verrucomicrobiia bacterium]
MKEDFFAKLDALVAAAKQYRTARFGEVDPEEATKQHLIEPLLESLGYTRDCYDKEFHILGDQVDYLLKHRRPLMFLEAKSLLDRSTNLFEAHQQQVTSYIRNYRISPEQAQMEHPVNWIVLTNFAQFHFIRVNEKTPSFVFRLDELIARREKLWELLALENLEANRIDELYDQEQKADLDKRFLADLKRWRLIIANGFALRNPNISLPDLTKASQQLLDRFIFCRMLETNRLIEYNRLARAFAHYEELYPPPATKPFAEVLKESLFAEIKRDFNTELFIRPQLCDQLAIDNIALAVVIGHEPLTPDVAGQCGIDQGQGELLASYKDLYGYDFSRMSTDIMGAVYERFLAHKLDRAGGRITIEDTDELRKKEGIYYTPRYIVDYIVDHTVGEKVRPILTEALALVAYKNYKPALTKIRELQHIKVLDAAMGSGSFLLRAFDTIAQAYADYNAECRKQKQERGRATLMLFDAPQEIAETVDHIGIHVASENIFGVDLDEQAVEVAKLNLWIRLMIAERDVIREILRVRRNGEKPLNLLPTLSNNLKRGNSLIDDPAVAGDAAFNWKTEFPDIMQRGGFDCVIGNPPFERLQMMQGSKPETVEFLKSNYKSATAGNFDIYVCFVERGLYLLAPAGEFGFIVPHKFCQSEYGKPLRKLLVDGQHVHQIVHFGDEQVFTQVTIYTCLLFLSKARNEKCLFIAAHDLAAWRETGKSAEREITISGASPWNFIGAAGATLFEKLGKEPQKLGDVADIFVGLQTSADDVFILNVIEEKRDTLRLYSRASGKDVTLERALCHPLVSGEDVTAYGTLTERQIVIFPYVVAGGKVRLLDFDVILKRFPKTAAYFLDHKKRLEDRENGKAKGSKWYGYLYLKNMARQSLPKLCVPRLVDKLHAAYDKDGEHFLDNVDVGGVTLKPDLEKIGLRYLLALLNSKLIRWYFPSVSAPFHSGFFSANRQFLSQIPIKLATTKAEKSAAAQVVKMADTLQSAHRRRLQLPRKLIAEVAHSHRTDCALAHYLQKDYKAAVTAEVLIDDLRRKGFVREILVQSGKKHIIITAEASDTKDASPVIQPIVRLTFTNPALQQFVYASWRSFLETNARKKTWTTGKAPQPIYDLIVNALQPLAFFHMSAADNLRAIRDLMKSVAKEVGTSDLAALEQEIADTDQAIDRLVYDLYGLTEEEIAIVASVTR